MSSGDDVRRRRRKGFFFPEAFFSPMEGAAERNKLFSHLKPIDYDKENDYSGGFDAAGSGAAGAEPQWKLEHGSGVDDETEQGDG